MSADAKSMANVHKSCCSFCAKSADQVKVLIAGPAIFICNECVMLCVDILIDHSVPSNVRPLPSVTEDSK